jgi:GNAT superfamily N-acetyltransferase
VSFRDVAENLRQSFRTLAEGRPGAEVVELAGVSIASLGVAFQMFNAAFLSEPVETEAELESRLRAAAGYFNSRGLPWAFWICEDWLAAPVRRKLSRACQTYGLRLSAEMPGMATGRLRPPTRTLPGMEVRPVEPGTALNDFRALGSTCFHVPIAWFSEVFDELVAERGAFRCWVGYREGSPVATAATVLSERALGIYNVATAPEHRKHGYAEAITRFAIDQALAEDPARRLVLQSTSQGHRLYDRMGFYPVTRVLVYNSAR